jgi:perosamine synthetase
MISVKKMILTAGPSITKKEILYVNDAVKNGWNNNWNNYLVKLEDKFKKYFKVKYALPTSSCTGAMHLILEALGIKKSDEVIVPDTTWVATASAVKYVGAKPIFADIDPKTWTMCPNSLEKKISKKTKAVIVVHLYGHPCKMDEIVKICKKNKIYLIEDAAPAVGAKFKNKLVGTFGVAAAFSFQGAKLIVSGEGGIIITSNSLLNKKIKQLAAHGRGNNKKKGIFWIEKVGFKYAMSNIQAALCLAQFERLEELVDRKRQIFSWYEKKLKNNDKIILNKESKFVRSTYWMTSIMLVKEKLNKKINGQLLSKILKKKGIDSRPIFPSISTYPMWRSNNNFFSKELSRYGINLPSGHNLKKPQVDYIAKTINKILDE